MTVVRDLLGVPILLEEVTDDVVSPVSVTDLLSLTHQVPDVCGRFLERTRCEVRARGQTCYLQYTDVGGEVRSLGRGAQGRHPGGSVGVGSVYRQAHLTIGQECSEEKMSVFSR